MLLKFLFLIFLAYMISRTVGNLLRAVRGGGERGTPIDSHTHRRFNQAFDIQNSDLGNTGSAGNSSSAEHTGSAGNSRSESGKSRSSNPNVEDAKWTDVQ